MATNLFSFCSNWLFKADGGCDDAWLLIKHPMWMEKRKIRKFHARNLRNNNKPIIHLVSLGNRMETVSVLVQWIWRHGIGDSHCVVLPQTQQQHNNKWKNELDVFAPVFPYPEQSMSLYSFRWKQLAALYRIGIPRKSFVPMMFRMVVWLAPAYIHPIWPWN